MSQENSTVETKYEVISVNLIFELTPTPIEYDKKY